MFVVANDGYVLLTKVEVDCGFSVSDSNGNSFSNSIAGFENAADHLWHSDKFTLPCFNILTLGGEPGMNRLSQPITQASLEIEIEYSFFYINLKYLRRHQTFHLRALRAIDNSFHWEFVS